jgi:glycogen debranching enzyme
VPTDASQFDEDRYWKGPTWLNTNWMVVNGLRVYEQHAVADDLTERTLDMVDRAGFYEYFSPLSGEGYGAPDFSWTAALVVDLVRRARSA